MVKFLLNLFFVLVFLFVVPLNTHAHLGGGPPFLKVNGKDAQTNPYNQGTTSAFTISWDTPPDVYLVNKPITFEINVLELMKATTISPDQANLIKIRWSVATGDDFETKDGKYVEGSKITKTFSKPGSYLVVIEAKLPNDSEYILINTVQIDVKPSVDYQLPFVTTYIGTQNDDPNKNVLLVSDATTDPTVKIKKYIWDFGDGKPRFESSVNRRFERVASVGVETVFHRVIDENGFVSDVGFYSQKVGNSIRFVPFTGNQNTPFVVGTYEEAQEKAKMPGKITLSMPAFIGLTFAVLFIVGGGWWLYLKKQSSPTRNVSHSDAGGRSKKHS